MANVTTLAPVEDRYDMDITISINKRDGEGDTTEFSRTMQEYFNMGEAGIVAIQAAICDMLIGLGVAKCVAKGFGDKLIAMGLGDRVAKVMAA